MSSTSDQPKLRVAIIGGGMGGMVLGLCLKKFAPDVHFDIYESAVELTEVGAGIGMTQRIWWVMKELELQEELLTITGAQNHSAGINLSYRKGDEEQAIDLFQFTQVQTFQRAILQQLLAKRLDASDKIHFSKRLASYSEPTANGPITLSFKDGTTATCDVLIGSDGVRSAVRRTMFNEYADEAEQRGQSDESARLRDLVEPVFSGQVAYRGLAPASALSEEALEHVRTPQIMLGKNGDMVFYPVSGGKFINVLAVKYTPGHGRTYDGPWVEPTTGEAVAKMFEGWLPKALSALKGVTDPFCWAMHTVPDLPTYVKGRAALVGDAAHAMLPHQGAGAGQAFEDGYILSLILAHPSVTLANLSEALKLYDEVRRPFSQGVLKGSDRNGATYQMRREGSGWENLSAEDSRAGRYPREWLAAIAEDVQAQMRWQLHTNIEDDRARVAERLATFSA